MNERQIIYEALAEWEENHYEYLDEKEQKIINKLIEDYMW